MTNAANEKKVKESKRDERNRVRMEKQDFHTVLSTVAGRNVLWRYLTYCKVFESTFTGNSTTYFNEGMRNVGLKMLSDIQTANPGALLQMMEDARDDAEKKNSKDEKEEIENG